MEKITAEQAIWFSETFNRIVANVEKAVIGKRHVVRLAVTCLLSEGHLLLEDYPGTGKTSLAKSLSNTVQGTSSRIQFTPDLSGDRITDYHPYWVKFDLDVKCHPTKYKADADDDQRDTNAGC